mgnify:CR=1 FL=1
MLNLKRVVGPALAVATLVVASGAAQAQQFFRIGTGGTAGTYYPVGGMIANAVSQPGKIVVTLRIEKSGRGGKTVTVIDGLPRNKDFVQALAGELKKALGTGGTAEESSVEIQGDRRDAIRQKLQSKGWRVKG